MRVAIYIRVSTTEQFQEGFSIPAQHEKLVAFCKSQSWDIIHVFTEEGVSAKDTNRPELQKLLKAIENREIDIVLVYKLDRLTRSILDLYSLLQIFDKYDVKFRSATEVYDTSTAIGRLFITLVAALAQWERENLSERVTMGMEQLVLSGHRAGGKPPFGYMKDPTSLKNEILIPHPEEKEVVREIYEMYLSGKGVRTICKSLNNRGILTSTGAQWTGRPLTYVLTNPIYIGQLRWGKNRDNVITAIGKHQPIIDTELWEAVQNEYKRREEIAPRFATGTYPFSGLLICGHCGTPMTIQQGQKQYPHKLYVCRKKDCPQIQIRMDVLEELFLKHLTLMVESNWEVDARNVTEEEKQLEETKAKIKKIEKKRKRWFELYENELISIKELKEKTLSMAQEKMELEQLEQSLTETIQRSHYVPHADLLKGIVSINEIWAVYSDEERKQLLNMLFDRIELYLLPEFLNTERIGKSVKGLRKRIKHSLKIYPRI